MPTILTASWFTPILVNHVRVGISRGTPRGMAAGYRLFKALAPGQWFHSTDAAGYLDLYRSEILEPLDPSETLQKILQLSRGHTPILTCYESAAKINAGETYCHRNIAGQWLADRLGIEVLEIAPENFDPWAYFRAQGIEPPSFK